ncbi:MAG: hypothetical protein AB7F23_08920 [Phycisphaerae bacterium]
MRTMSIIALALATAGLCAEIYTGSGISSPAIEARPGGGYTVKFDVSAERPSGKTLIFSSADGESWSKDAELQCFGASLFAHRSELYLLGTAFEGRALIMRSNKGSFTGAQTATLLNERQYTSSAGCVVVSGGRIWKVLEDTFGIDGTKREFMLSARLDSDLLRPASWLTSNKTALPADMLAPAVSGIGGGCAIPTPSHEVINMFRVRSSSRSDGTACFIRHETTGITGEFKPQTNTVALPGNGDICVRYDADTRAYWTIVNGLPGGEAGKSLVLMQSDNLTDWVVKKVLAESGEAIYGQVSMILANGNIIALVEEKNGSESKLIMITVEKFAKIRGSLDYPASSDFAAKPNPAFPLESSLVNPLDVKIEGKKVLWLTTYFKAPEKWFDNNIWVCAGKVDDIDDTYVNGVKVGSRGRGENAWAVRRVYKIPRGTIVSGGWNKLCIRVTNKSGEGGIREIAGVFDMTEQITLDGLWLCSELDDTAIAAVGSANAVNEEALKYAERSGIDRTAVSLLESGR